MKTNTQNRPYLDEVYLVRAEIRDKEDRLVRVLVFDWNERESVRRFAEQCDRLLRAGYTSALTPMLSADTPRSWLGDVLAMTSGTSGTEVNVTYAMKQRALGLLRRFGGDPISKWIFQLFQQPTLPATYRFGEYETKVPISLEMKREAIRLLEFRLV